MNKSVASLLVMACLCGLAQAQTPATMPAGAQALAIRGHAVSVGSQGVPNVKVTLAASARGEERETDLGSAATDANGWFEIRVPQADLGGADSAPSGLVDIRISIDVAPDATLAPIAVRSPFVRGWRPDPNQTLAPISILLAPATGQISGTVLTDSNEPLAGATIRFTLPSAMGSVARQAVTDSAGHYEIARLGYGTYTVLDVRPPAGSACIAMAPFSPLAHGVRSVPLGDGATRREDFTLHKGGRIIGRVLAGSKPLAGAQVSCGMDAANDVGNGVWPKGPGHGASAKTDANGVYILGGLARETYSVHLRGPAGSNLAPASLRGVSIPDAADAAVQDVSLAEGGRLIVVARGADGKAAAGVKLNCHNVEAQTDANGVAVFVGLPTGKYPVTLSGPGSDYGQAVAVGGMTTEATVALPAPKEATPPPQPTNVKPAKGAIVTGVVTDPNGEALKDCRVLLVQGGRGGANTLASAKTDANGHYEIVTSQAAPCQIVVGPGMGRNLLPAETPAQAFKADQTTTVDVALKPGCVIAGKVGRDGKPAPWASVALRSKSPATAGVTWVVNNGQLPATHTKIDGNFRIEGLSPGKYDVTVTPLDPQYSPVSISVTAAPDEAKEMDISLLRTGSLGGHIRGSDGKAVSSEDAGVSIQAKDGQQSAMVTISKDGALSAQGVAPGQYSLTVYVHPKGTKRGLGKAAPVDVTIDEDKTADVDVTVPVTPTSAPVEAPPIAEPVPDRK